MTTMPRLKDTSVRTRLAAGEPRIDLRHTAIGAAEMPITTPWIEMTVADAQGLIERLREALDDLNRGRAG